jgi:hypothetical protein
MKRHFLYFISIITILTIAGSCGTTAKLYPYDDKNRTIVGQLSDSEFVALKQYLIATTNSNLKDTIIIKYDFNNETCWERLDQREDENIMGFVKRHQEAMQQVLATRKNVSAFDFREPGDNLNKIKMWDNSIIIDSSMQLFNLFFKYRSNCGNSIIVMPDKKFVYIHSDPHSEILYLTQKQIENILNAK